MQEVQEDKSQDVSTKTVMIAAVSAMPPQALKQAPHQIYQVESRAVGEKEIVFARMKEEFENAKSRVLVSRYRYGEHGKPDNHQDRQGSIFGCMSCEPGIKAVLFDRKTIDLLILIVSFDVLGLRLAEGQAEDFGVSNMEALFAENFGEAQSIGDMIAILKRLQKRNAEESAAEIETSKRVALCAKVSQAESIEFADDEKWPNVTLTGSLEYLLRELDFFCSDACPTAAQYSITKVKLVAAPFDVPAMKDDNREDKDYIGDRKRIATDIAIRAVRYATEKIINDNENASNEELSIYIDSNGGIRDIMTTIVAAIRLMRIQKITPKGVMVSEFEPGHRNTATNPFRITNNTNMYDTFDLVSGLDEFISYGRGEKICRYYPQDRLFDCLDKMGKVFLLCSPTKMLDAVDKVVKVLKTEKTSDDAVFDDMREYIVSAIKQDMNDLLFVANRKSAERRLEEYLLPLIQWCLKKELIQQALTLYAEKMPELIVNKKILYYDTKPKGEESILSDLVEMKKEKERKNYALEYIFIQQYLVVSNGSGYRSRIGRNPKRLSVNSRRGIEKLLEVGMKERTRTLRSNWSDRKDTVSSILRRYYVLKGKRDDMNHANNVNTNIDDIIKEIKEGLVEIKSLLN